MANHKLSIDTTQDPCKFSLDSTFKIDMYIVYKVCNKWAD
jgi:hypothetical protein